MTYIDGFLAPVPTANKDAYLRHAELAAKVFKDVGATKVVECWGDDVPDGKLTSMPLAVKLEPGESVVLSWILWPDKATRDAGWAKAMEDPRMAPDANPFPFDGRRLIHGGFEMLMET